MSDGQLSFACQLFVKRFAKNMMQTMQKKKTTPCTTAAVRFVSPSSPQFCLPAPIFQPLFPPPSPGLVWEGRDFARRQRGFGGFYCMRIPEKCPSPTYPSPTYLGMHTQLLGIVPGQSLFLCPEDLPKDGQHIAFFQAMGMSVFIHSLAEKYG